MTLHITMSKPKNPEPISHHYVPKLYLRKFSNKKGKEFYLYSFDKELKKVYSNNINNVCCEDYFNELIYGIPNSYYDDLINEIGPDERIKKVKSKEELYDMIGNEEIEKAKSIKELYELIGDKEQTFFMPLEKTFNVNETEFNRVYKKIIDLEDISQLSDQDRAVTATFLIYQWKRTKVQRNFIKNIILNFLKKQMEIANSVEYILCLYFLCNNDLLLRYLHILNIVNIEDAFKAFLNMGWTLCINKTNFPYWTSDNPFVLENIIEIEQNSAMQIREGFKIYLPLSPKICLMLYDPFFYNYPSKIFDIDVKSVSEKNMLQVASSLRNVFSFDDISLINELINKPSSS